MSTYTYRRHRVLEYWGPRPHPHPLSPRPGAKPPTTGTGRRPAPMAPSLPAAGGGGGGGSGGGGEKPRERDPQQQQRQQRQDTKGRGRRRAQLPQLGRGKRKLGEPGKREDGVSGGFVGRERKSLGERKRALDEAAEFLKELVGARGAVLGEKEVRGLETVWGVLVFEGRVIGGEGGG